FQKPFLNGDENAAVVASRSTGSHVLGLNGDHQVDVTVNGQTAHLNTVQRATSGDQAPGNGRLGYFIELSPGMLVTVNDQTYYNDDDDEPSTTFYIRPLELYITMEPLSQQIFFYRIAAILKTTSNRSKKPTAGELGRRDGNGDVDAANTTMTWTPIPPAAANAANAAFLFCHQLTTSGLLKIVLERRYFKTTRYQDAMTEESRHEGALDTAVAKYDITYNVRVHPAVPAPSPAKGKNLKALKRRHDDADLEFLDSCVHTSITTRAEVGERRKECGDDEGLGFLESGDVDGDREVEIIRARLPARKRQRRQSESFSPRRVLSFALVSVLYGYDTIFLLFVCAVLKFVCIVA
ncbi:hypothetical protein EJ02DRAFT_481956, partial [Clathrospora elynae]